MFNFLDDLNIDHWTQAIETFVTHQATIAPFLLLFLEEAGVPLPVPGDVYLAFVGYRVAKARMLYPVAFLGLLFAILAGSSILYFLSARFGNTIILKIGKYIHLDQKKVSYVEDKFKRYGVWVIIFGRHIPGFRIPITFFSGISGVPYSTFILSTFISVVFWIAFYLSLGAQLGRSVLKLFHANPFYYFLFAAPLILAALVAYYARYKRNKKMKSEEK